MAAAAAPPSLDSFPADLIPNGEWVAAAHDTETELRRKERKKERPVKKCTSEIERAGERKKRERENFGSNGHKRK